MKILLFCYTEAVVWIIFSFCSFETAFALVLAATTASDSAAALSPFPSSLETFQISSLSLFDFMHFSV